MIVDWARLAVWVPTAAVAATALVGCACIVLLPERRARRSIGLAALLLSAGMAAGATVWQRQWQERQALGQEQATEADEAAQRAAIARERAEVTRAVTGLGELRRRLDALEKQLPPGQGHAPDGKFDTVSAGLAVVARTIDVLESQIAVFREEARGRAIPDATAAAMSAYLRPLGPQRVVVSCVPGDAEAYAYANRLATILRQAAWQAVGPEATTIFGTAPSMAVGIYVHPNEPPVAAHAVIDAFTRFNIPYQSRIPSTPAVADGDALELFVGKKP